MRARLWVVLAIGSLAVHGCGGGTSSPPPADARNDVKSDAKDAGPADRGADLAPDGAGDVAGDRGALDTGVQDTGKDMVTDTPGDGAVDTREAGVVDSGPDVAAPTCSDHIKNSDETDIDCGGHCGKCGPSKTCLIGADCTFGICRSDHTCGECNLAPDCPGAESECQHRSCTAGVCGIARDAVGTVVALQTSGDCKSRQCAADGTVSVVNDNSDLPDDRNPCTNDFCTTGVPSHMTLPLNTSCGGLNRCNASGQCVGCLTGSDCPGADTACQTRTCSAQGVCGFDFKAVGTVLTDPTAGDCKGLQCDGAGNTQAVNNNTDLPVDNNPCTTDECTAGTPSHRPVSSGTACGTGLVCDGANRCVACLSASTCPGTDTECHTRTCVNGTCGISNTTGGTNTAAQVAKDCKRIECDGTGSTFTVPDVTDLPDDGNPCTADLCNGATPSNPNIIAGTNCGGTSVCDGAGLCVACLTASTCPGSDTECHTRTCSATHQCGLMNAPVGKLLALQTTGDCKRNQCDGNGNTQTANDDTDVPIDSNVCTQDLCNGGTPSNPALTMGTACGVNLICNGSGACVGCVTVADCPGVDTACQQRSCTSGQCVVTNATPGVVIPSQTPGDCKSNQCDSAGNIVAVADDTDLPVDGNQCTQDVCTNGVPSHPSEPVETACNQNSGTRCNGIAGMEACVQCNNAGQCPGGADNECRSRTCSASGQCGVSFTMAGTVLSSSSQTPGDCQRNQCDGAGNIVSMVDATDTPISVSSCNPGICSGGTPGHMLQPIGTVCADNGGSVCNGVGSCVSCNVATDCPGTDTECRTRVCSAQGLCSLTFTGAGTTVSAQTPNDYCHKDVCDGAGNIVRAVDDTDVFVDGNQCTMDVCSAGNGSNPPQASGFGCTQGGLFCNGAGTCVQCVSDANCDTSHDPVCSKTQCVAGVCGLVPVLNNTVVTDTTAGDCHKNICDGTGGVSSVVDDSDLPVDGLTCTQDVCTSGVVTNPAVTVGTACSQNGGTRCDATGSCVPTFMVARIGDGTATPLTNAATPVFIEERLESGGGLLRVIGVPSAAATSPLPLTLSGTADSEGALALSGDKHSVSIAGYSAAAGTPAIASTAAATTPRGAAVVFTNGSVDTSTTFGTTAFDANNVRSAVSSDGTKIWAAGDGPNATRGVFFATIGAITSTLIESTTNAGRVCEIVAGQLYCDAAKGIQGIFAVGTGLPTMTLTPTAALPGTTVDTAGSYFGFVLLDMTGNDGVLDTLYIADDRATAPGGIQKWTLTAGTWTLVWTTNNVAGTAGVRGLTGYAAGSNVVLLATTASASPAPNAIIRLIDSGPTPTAASVTTLVPAVAGAVTVYRGIALSPQ